MVVLAAAVCTKSGKALVSRQFVDISRVRIEGLLAAFPKLMGSGRQGHAGAIQHTFIETETVRYVYQPLEGLYMLLLTNKSSNILEDLDTLHLLAKLVPEYCGRLEEEQVADKAFELIFAFDEVIAVGYKEKVTLQQIKTFLEMDSQEEKIHEMLEKNKEREAKEEATRRRQQIESMKSKQAGNMGGMGGMGSSGGRWQGSGGGGSSFDSPQIPADPFVVKETRAAPKPAPSRGGMVLGQKEPTSKFLQAMKKEEGADLIREETSTSTNTPGAPPVARERVNIEVVEVVSATVENDGGLQSPLDVRGDLTLTIDDPAAARVLIHVAPSADHKSFTFKAHPNINRDRWTKERVVAPKGDKAFPAGTALNVLKWRWQTSDEGSLPLTVSCWPTPGGDGTTAVTLEYELQRQDFVLSNVRISIPIIGSTPTLGEIAGDYDFDVKNHILHWKLDFIDESNSTGSAEFSMGAVDASSLFPITISYTSNNTFCPIEIEQVVSPDEEPIRYALSKSLQTDQYQLVQ